jgi:hypothetical protein
MGWAVIYLILDWDAGRWTDDHTTALSLERLVGTFLLYNEITEYNEYKELLKQSPSVSDI